MQLTLPTVLTLGRLVLVPILVLLFYLPFEWAGPAAAVVFALGGFTDWLDGYLARRLNQTSSFGAFLDPVADKVMVAIVLVMLVQANPHLWMALPAMVIIGREIVISALREWMAEIGQRAQVAVSSLGKIKTVAQIAALLLMLYHDPIGALPTFLVGVALLYMAALLTLYSMVVYLRAGWSAANRAEEEAASP
ncbi:MAG: CDP-diacylglycerol--glycerol-3-phosphate 3-phosphatidyltransferase [Halofilum sp. (in: g-proteobacteria)]|nr:CDP-diacylglycerol--glycerol-3-phosphate 3-phosphatidyltransferase [Halofilum sp. (in: g-proteobacteria)]